MMIIWLFLFSPPSQAAQNLGTDFCAIEVAAVESSISKYQESNKLLSDLLMDNTLVVCDRDPSKNNISNKPRLAGNNGPMPGHTPLDPHPSSIPKAAGTGSYKPDVSTGLTGTALPPNPLSKGLPINGELFAFLRQLLAWNQDERTKFDIVAGGIKKLAGTGVDESDKAQIKKRQSDFERLSSLYTTYSFDHLNKVLERNLDLFQQNLVEGQKEKYFDFGPHCAKLPKLVADMEKAYIAQKEAVLELQAYFNKKAAGIASTGTPPTSCKELSLH